MNEILTIYGNLLQEVDEWFAACIKAYPEQISCGRKCSGCCRGLFDITLLDACYLKFGFDKLPSQVREKVHLKARAKVDELKQIWPGWSEPFILNVRPEEEWESLMPDDDETPCPLLDDDGSCLIYPYRPMTCRLHGLPLIDVSGEPFHDEWCSLNFKEGDPQDFPDLKWQFQKHFKDELLLFHSFTEHLFGHQLSEVDTFIPTALFIDFDNFDWKRWIQDPRNNNALQ